MQIVGAMDPSRIEGEPAFLVLLRVWFAGLDGWCWFVASPLDPEPHGKELWIRAMAGEYGEFVPARKFDLLRGPG